MNNKYPVHDDYRKIPVFDIKFGGPMIGLINIAMKLDIFFRCRKPAAGIRREVHQLTTADAHRVDITVMTPTTLQGPAPAVIYCHGGAFAMTYASMHVQMCERYALEAGCIVMLVNYRLAPKYPFPSGFDDCYAALQWAIGNANTLGIDVNRIAVMGDSAGGALAAGVAQKAMDNGINLCAQVLVYPVLDSECKTPSATDFFDAPLWNAVGNRRMWEMYLKNTGGKPPEYAAPGLRTSLAGLPRCYVDTAEFDPLRDEGIAYANALAAQGIEVKLNQTHGTIHGYEMAPKNEQTQASMLGRIAFLRESFQR